MREKINLAIRGGGVKVPAIGVMKRLEEEEITISSYSGTSIGSIIATLGALEVPATEIEYLIKKYVVEYSNASRIKGGKGSKIIEETVNAYCNKKTFKDLEKGLYIVANEGGLWNPKAFVFCKENTPEVTLGEACRASCSFPIAYEHYKLKVNGTNKKFWDGGMAANPIIPNEGFWILSTFQKKKENLKSRYVNAWKDAEEKADFIIKPKINLGTFGTPEDIAIAVDVGYTETQKHMEELLHML